MLTEAQRRSWGENGYLHVPGAVPSENVAELLRAIDRLQEKYSATDSEKQFHIGLDRKFVVAEGPVFRDLMDSPYGFPHVLEIMGPCIQLSMSHALVRPAGNAFEGFVHTDGGQAMQSIRLAAGSRPLQVKVQYFLTDVDGEYCGNFLYKKGSHATPFPVYGGDGRKIMGGMEQLRVKAGDIAIFASGLWHGATRNESVFDRKSLIYGYNQMCMRPYDYAAAPQELLAACTGRQRRLLGDMGTSRPQAHYYAPKDHVAVMEGVTDLMQNYAQSF